MDALANLGIDGWGLLLYLVNFGLLLWLMQRYVYKPLVKYLDKRRDQIKEDVDRAAMLRKDLDAEREGESAQRAKRLEALDAQVKDAKQLARTEAKQMIADAETQRDAILSNASKTADATIAATMSDAEGEILERVRRVVTHVLEDGVPQDLVDKSVQDSWKRVTKAS